MKAKSLVLAALLATTQASILIDEESDISISNENESVKNKDRLDKIKDSWSELQKSDQSLIEDYSLKLKQSDKNINMGEMG